MTSWWLRGCILIWWHWFRSSGWLEAWRRSSGSHHAPEPAPNGSFCSRKQHFVFWVSVWCAGWLQPQRLPGAIGWRSPRLCSGYRPSEGALWAVVASQPHPCWWNELRSLFLTRPICFLAVDWSGLEVSKKDQNNGQNHDATTNSCSRVGQSS